MVSVFGLGQGLSNSIAMAGETIDGITAAAMGLIGKLRLGPELPSNLLLESLSQESHNAFVGDLQQCYWSEFTRPRSKLPRLVK